MIQTAEADAPTFPYAGSIAYLGGKGEKVKIVQRKPDGTSLVQRIGPLSRFEGASRNRTEENTNLFATFEDAIRFKAALEAKLSRRENQRSGSATKTAKKAQRQRKAA